MYNNPNVQRQQPYQANPNPPSANQQFRVSKHGVFGVGAIALMIIIAFVLKWEISWWYLVVSTIGYASAVIALTLMEEQTNDPSYRFLLFRWLIGCHVAFLLLAGGLFFNQVEFPVQVGIFLAAAALGIAIPFMLFRK